MLQPNVEEKTVTSSSAIDLPYESRGLQPSELLQSSDELGVKKGKASSWAVILVCFCFLLPRAHPSFPCT
jgi:hypothetical protein